MLELNIDKQTGIQLHTCERKSRWCQFFLWLSWLLMLAFLGWLFWKGMIGNASTLLGSPTVTPTKSAEPQIVQKLIADCETNDATSKAKADACKKQLSELEKRLNQQFNQKYAQHLKKSGEKLKNTKKALQQSRQQLKALEAKLLTVSGKPDSDLKEKLFFYEKILGSNGIEDAVFINYFAAKALDKKRHYRFQLILARLGKHKKTTGKYDIFLKGTKAVEVKEKEKLADGKTREKIIIKKEPVTYKHTDLLPAEAVSGQNTFTFKYYQIVEGEFILPAKFDLESLSVSVMPEGLSSVKNNYKWDNLKQQAFKEFK